MQKLHISRKAILLGLVLLLSPWSLIREEYWIAGWGAMIYETQYVVYGTTFYTWPPPAGPYYGPWEINYPVIILQITLIALFIILRRKEQHDSNRPD